MRDIVERRKESVELAIEKKTKRSELEKVDSHNENSALLPRDDA